MATLNTFNVQELFISFGILFQISAPWTLGARFIISNRQLGTR